jgi:hypothetical protein
MENCAMTDIDVEEELQNANKGMEETEDELAATGFSKEHWELIRRYILTAITRQELINLRSAHSWKGGG